MLSAVPKCPVCESAQETGDECAVCGLPFAPRRDTGLGIEKVEGLEHTRFDGAEGEGEPLGDLESTRYERAPDVAGARVDVEPTRCEAVALAVEPLGGLEPTLLAVRSDEESKPVPAVCRYCRAPAAPSEVFCAHCGMRLPGARAVDRAPAEPMRCRSCGTPGSGDVCGECGARLAP